MHLSLLSRMNDTITPYSIFRMQKLKLKQKLVQEINALLTVIP